MEFPVDGLAHVSHEDLESSAQIYMNKLLYSNPDTAQYLTIPNNRKIHISLSNVGFVPLYGANLKYKVMALFAPEDQLKAIALFLANQWWAVEDILKTADPNRTGLIKVRTLGERIVLYVLNRIVYRANEMSSNEVPFLCHGENDYAKILWKNGEAVAFYSVKPRGSVCSTFVSQCYQLSVMNSIFVRKCHRGNGHGLQMLEDFVDSFQDEELGLKYPLSRAMYRVCDQYLRTYPADENLLWEAESVGRPYQRTRVACKLRSLALEVSDNSTGEGGQTVKGQVTLERTPLENCLNITEEVVKTNEHTKNTEEIEKPVSTRTRSSSHRKKRLRKEMQEEPMEIRPEKISRLMETEEEMKPEIKMAAQQVRQAGQEPVSAPLVENVQVAVSEEGPASAEFKETASEGNGDLADEKDEQQVEAAAKDTEEEMVGEEFIPETDLVHTNGMAEEVEMAEDPDITQDSTLSNQDTVDVAQEDDYNEPLPVGECKEEEGETEVLTSSIEDHALPTSSCSPGQDDDECVEGAFLVPSSPEKEGKGHEEEEVMWREPSVLLVGVTEVSYEPPEGENHHCAAEEMHEEEEKTAEVTDNQYEEGTRGSEEGETKSMEENERRTHDGKNKDVSPMGAREHLGSIRAFPPKSQRKSRRLNQVSMDQEAEEEEKWEDEEEKSITTEEEEKATTTEEEGVEGRSSDEWEEHLAVDRRDLRKKGKAAPSTMRTRSGRSSKN
ncbi:soluble lamin-associated protein of 75 kDa isoform X2 [Denticeps clupeoides]|uniref:Soluble lamin-associated protein of 75 kDa-like n=1 Tax=Denticeps clupeoides TaxID=299321 RepID=A0AAY4EQP7_9TELE|nr:soluble lamin-associated protein of 75 kDa isoform X2 [Denticeps clupeoides]